MNQGKPSSADAACQDDSIVTCIIPAYNEEARISNVLDVVVESPDIDEIIVVNDGSADGTAELVRKYESNYERINLIDLQPNRGKAYALKQGITAARGNIILLLDADLDGLTIDNIKQLLVPVVDGDIDMTLSLRKNSLFIYKLFGLDLVSGERAISKQILENLQEYEDARFGFESILNEHIIDNKLKFDVVKWNNVTVAPKHKKVGFWKGIKGEMDMIREIFQAVPVAKWAYIFFRMVLAKPSPRSRKKRQTKSRNS
jgi:glycosyltransferase involved in cell wall biosynthesis